MPGYRDFPLALEGRFPCLLCDICTALGTIRAEKSARNTARRGPADLPFPVRLNPLPDKPVSKMSGTIEHVQLGATAPVSLDARTDEDLLLGYGRRGDRRVFDELVYRYERELFGYLRRYLGDAQQAEDVFQQTFLQVHLKCGQFEPGRKVRPWLYAIATNQAIDLQRRNRRHRMASLDRRRGGDSQDESGTLGQLLDSPEPDPVEQLQLAERREQVRRAVDDLPEPARQVVILVYFQGLKYREAAEVLSIPVGTVKSRLHTAIHKLSETLN
jgi:RNA polymerase sigma-70 factor (ECF subfamily)